MSASATARLDGGRGMELDIQAYMTTNPAYDCAIKNLLQLSINEGITDEAKKAHREM